MIFGNNSGVIEETIRTMPDTRKNTESPSKKRREGWNCSFMFLSFPMTKQDEKRKGKEELSVK